MNYKLKTVTLNVSCGDSKTLNQPSLLADYCSSIFENLDSAQEHFILLCLDGNHRVIGYKILCSGTQSSCNVDCTLLWRAALALGARCIAIAHNHPTGALEPSQDDIAITKKILDGGELLDIELIDHLIITTDNHLSICQTYANIF